MLSSVDLCHKKSVENMTGRSRGRRKKQASRRKGPPLPAADHLPPTDPDAKVELPSRSGSPVKAKKPPTRSGSSRIAE